MDHFGLKSAKDLPKLKDVILDENEIGTPVDMQYAESDNTEGVSITLGTQEDNREKSDDVAE